MMGEGKHKGIDQEAGRSLLLKLKKKYSTPGPFEDKE